MLLQGWQQLRRLLAGNGAGAAWRSSRIVAAAVGTCPTLWCSTAVHVHAVAAVGVVV
jgi:hypothetical protein